MAVMLERWDDDKMDVLDAKVGRVVREVGVHLEHTPRPAREGAAKGCPSATAAGGSAPLRGSIFWALYGASSAAGQGRRAGARASAVAPSSFI